MTGVLNWFIDIPMKTSHTRWNRYSLNTILHLIRLLIFGYCLGIRPERRKWPEMPRTYNKNIKIRH
jgi:hypothetical protein